MAAVGYVVVYVALVVISYLVNGWALSVLWGWFIRPLFHLPALAIGPAIGVALVVGLLTRSYRSSTAEERGKSRFEQWFLPGIVSVLGAAVTVGVGWVVQALMGAAS